MKKIAQIRSTSPTTAYTDYLGKEKTIDDLYMKSIKMKIATAQISWNRKSWGIDEILKLICLYLIYLLQYTGFKLFMDS